MKIDQKSQTWKNLKAAFAEETTAAIKYDIFAKKAKKEDLNVISERFATTAAQERTHATIWFKQMNEGVSTTSDNLKNCIEVEHFETTKMYREFSLTAEAEGYEDLAKLFSLVGDIEGYHEKRFQNLLELVNTTYFADSNEDTLWICTKCGHLHYGKEAPLICPVCKHPQQYFVRESTTRI